jgi:5-methylcytosine-specific restriction protein A
MVGKKMSMRLCPQHGLYPANGKGCPKCSKARAKVYDTFYRDEELDKFYHSKVWRRVRILQLKSSPVCEICKIKPAVIVDHIKEIKDGGSKLDFDNLQSLCRECHNTKTYKEKLKREGL